MENNDKFLKFAKSRLQSLIKKGNYLNEALENFESEDFEDDSNFTSIIGSLAILINGFLI